MLVTLGNELTITGFRPYLQSPKHEAERRHADLKLHSTLVIPANQLEYPFVPETRDDALEGGREDPDISATQH